MTLPATDIDLQATTPDVALALDDVGVRGIVRGIVLDGAPTTARIDVDCSLTGGARGAHMSRFHEAIDQALLLVGDEGADVRGLEVLTAVIASRAADLQGSERATATVRATIAQARIAPASGRRTVDPFDVWSRVEVRRGADGDVRTRVTLGVSASGMTACPCAQLLVRDAAIERLGDAGIDDETIAAVLEHVPIATHNQRSTGSLEVHVHGDAAVTAIVEPVELVELVRGSMSTGIHELLKRDDELAVVEAAHADPRFVEDCVRALLLDAVAHPVLAQLPATTELTARQVNHESIHAHDVASSRSASLAQLRVDLDLEPDPQPA